MSARIGKLRHRLTIEQPVRAEDGGGGSATSWAALGEVWGAVEAATGDERIGADRVTGHAACTITIRYRADVTPSMRFRRGTELFHILAALDKDGRRRLLTCQCERRDL